MTLTRYDDYSDNRAANAVPSNNRSERPAPNAAQNLRLENGMLLPCGPNDDNAL